MWKEEEMRQRGHPVSWPRPAPETAAWLRLLLSDVHCEGERSDFPSASTPPRTDDLRGSLLNYVELLLFLMGNQLRGAPCVFLSHALMQQILWIV